MRPPRGRPSPGRSSWRRAARTISGSGAGRPVVVTGHPRAVAQDRAGGQHEPRAYGRGPLRISRRVLGSAVERLLEQTLCGLASSPSVSRSTYVSSASRCGSTSFSKTDGGPALRGPGGGTARRRHEQIRVQRRLPRPVGRVAAHGCPSLPRCIGLPCWAAGSPADTGEVPAIRNSGTDQVVPPCPRWPCPMNCWSLEDRHVLCARAALSEGGPARPRRRPGGGHPP